MSVVAILGELRRKVGTFDADRSLVYLRAHWDNLDGKPATFNPATHDATHDDHNDERYAAKSNAVYYVVGNASGSAGIWTGVIPGITEYYTGLTIAYKIGIAGGASATSLSINGYAAKTVRRNTGNLTTTHLPVGTVVILTYDGTNWVWADYDSNTTYSAMTVAEGQTGTAISLRTMRADYLKEIIEHRVNNTGIVNLNGGTLGGLSFTGKYTVIVPAGATRWVRLCTVSNLSAGKLAMTLGGTNTQQAATIEFKNSHYTEGCSIIVTTQSYNPIIKKVQIYGENGGDKSIYVEIDAISFERSITYSVYDLVGTLMSIDNSVSNPSSSAYSRVVVVPYEGNVMVSNGLIYASSMNWWGTEAHRASASIEPSRTDGSKQLFIYTGTITRTIRIPANSAQGFPVGTEFVIINYNTGPTAFAPDGGVTINGSGSLPAYTTRYKPLRLIKVDADAWVTEFSV